MKNFETTLLSFIAVIILADQKIEAASVFGNKTISPLSKFVAALSKPGAFAKEVKMILGDDYTEQQSKCPSGDEGLECRRKEARNGAESCYGGGDCTECQSCSELKSNQWLSCCENHFLCCSSLALACQKCDQPELLPFCMKRFKKCFGTETS